MGIIKTENKLKKVLSRFDVLFLSFGAMIGWGWVVLSGIWITEAGTLGAMLAFVIGGILVIFVGLTYSELASAMPKVGGELVYVLRALGKNLGFVAAWAVTLGYVSVVAFQATALPTVIEFFFPNYRVGYMWTIQGWDVHLSWVLVGVLGALFVMFVNYIGIKIAAIVQMIFTLMIAVMGILLISGASVTGSMANAEPLFLGGMAGIMTVIVMTPFMFVGFDVIPQAAEEMNIKRKSIGKILIFSVFLAVFWYIAIIFGVGVSLDKPSLVDASLPTAAAMGAIFGSEFFAKLLVAGGIAGILTSWNAFIIGGSRVLYAMAEARMLPAWFGKLHPKYKTPANAILFIGCLSVLSPLFGRPMLVWLVDAGGFAVVIAYFLVAWAFLRLRKDEPNMSRPFRAGKSNVVGWFAIVMSLGFIVLYLPGMPAALSWPAEWFIFAGWSLLGVFFWARMRKTLTDEHVDEYLKDVVELNDEDEEKVS